MTPSAFRRVVRFALVVSLGAVVLACGSSGAPTTGSPGSQPDLDSSTAQPDDTQPDDTQPDDTQPDDTQPDVDVPAGAVEPFIVLSTIRSGELNIGPDDAEARWGDLPAAWTAAAGEHEIRASFADDGSGEEVVGPEIGREVFAAIEVCDPIRFGLSESADSDELLVTVILSGALCDQKDLYIAGFVVPDDAGSAAVSLLPVEVEILDTPPL